MLACILGEFCKHATRRDVETEHSNHIAKLSATVSSKTTQNVIARLTWWLAVYSQEINTKHALDRNCIYIQKRPTNSVKT